VVAGDPVPPAVAALRDRLVQAATAESSLGPSLPPRGS
jgi:hypothetical protein